MVTNLWDDWKTSGGEKRKVPSLQGKNSLEGKYYGYADAFVPVKAPVGLSSWPAIMWGR